MIDPNPEEQFHYEESCYPLVRLNPLIFTRNHTEIVYQFMHRGYMDIACKLLFKLVWHASPEASCRTMQLTQPPIFQVPCALWTLLEPGNFECTELEAIENVKGLTHTDLMSRAREIGTIEPQISLKPSQLVCLTQEQEQEFLAAETEEVTSSIEWWNTRAERGSDFQRLVRLRSGC